MFLRFCFAIVFWGIFATYATQRIVRNGTSITRFGFFVSILELRDQAASQETPQGNVVEE